MKNVFAEQMFTLQQSNIVPRANLKNNFVFLLSRKDVLGMRLAIKSCLHLIYFHSYSFATGMANMSPNTLINRVLLKNSTEKKCAMRNHSWNNEKPGSRLDVFYKIPQCGAGVSFLNKVSWWKTATLLRRDSSTGSFLWILRNSQKHFF